MPGPFPGMDPYLEDPILWPGFHHSLIEMMRHDLNRRLPGDFVANVDERIYLVQPERKIIPDVTISRERPRAGGTAVLPERSAPWVLTVHPWEVTEGFIEIRRIGGEGEVVTVIELLSPTNKASGNPGRVLYLTKQQELLESRTNLVEIDLLRGGEHTVAPPLAALQERGAWDYLVVVHRASAMFQYEVWPNVLREPLPEIRIPLDTRHDDIALDLQAAFDLAYDGGRYPQQLKYAGPPPVPLNDDDAAWADALLRGKGLRPEAGEAA